MSNWSWLILSWQRPLSYRNQSTDFQSKSMDWFLYDNGLRHERVNWGWVTEAAKIAKYVKTSKWCYKSNMFHSTGDNLIHFKENSKTSKQTKLFYNPINTLFSCEEFIQFRIPVFRFFQGPARNPLGSRVPVFRIF